MSDTQATPAQKPAPPRTIFVFLDGVGLGEPDGTHNPLFRGHCPTLAGWLETESVPVDACLGVDGLPQSATGQTALFTGRNAPREIGRHQSGYPGPWLRRIIEQTNLFQGLIDRGRTCTFANAYYLGNLTPDQIRRRRSVTTVMTLHALGQVRTVEDLVRGEAVYNDLTRERLRERGSDAAVISSRQAADDLLRVAGQFDFTLFEFFLTDILAHKGTPEEKAVMLATLDAFLARLAGAAEEDGTLLLVTSDHGNLEDECSRSHTRNPVPLIARGPGGDRLRERVGNLADVTPALLRLDSS